MRIFQGFIIGVSVWSRALFGAESAGLYIAPTPMIVGSELGLEGHWALVGSPHPAVDSSLAGIHGVFLQEPSLPPACASSCNCAHVE